MCIEKMTDDAVFCVCRCGLEREIPIGEFSIAQDAIVFPVCKCGFAMFARLVPADSVGENVDLHTAIHSLARRLISAGQIAVDACGERCSVDGAMYTLGEEWSGGEQNFRLHRSFEAARKGRVE